jgi:hypothetical protein
MSKPQQAQQATTPTNRAHAMLLDFLREHDAPCPVCGYNLRALTRPICPECGHELALTVGAPQLRLGWLLAAVAPGFFSGIAALFLLIPIVGRLLFGDGRMSPVLNALDLFGWSSGLFAILLARNRLRFIAQPRPRQRWYALAIWLVHVAALGLFIILGPRYLR